MISEGSSIHAMPKTSTTQVPNQLFQTFDMLYALTKFDRIHLYTLHNKCYIDGTFSRIFEAWFINTHWLESGG
jgi:hypothetical protein